MRIRNFFFSVCCLIAINASAQTLDWFSLWGSSTEGSHIRVNRMAIDSDDNTYTAADFCGNAVKVGDETLISQQGSDLGDAALIKTSPNNEIIWTRIFSESRISSISDITVDSHDNIIVAGTFTGTINPGGNQSLTLDDGEFDDCAVNAFVARFDKDGTLLSQWQIPVYEITSLRVTTDNNDNVYIAGTYGSYIQFTGTTGVGTFSVDNQLFLAKYSSTGELLSSRYTEATNLSVNNAAIQVASNGDIYITGTFAGTFAFAGKTFATTADNDMFLAKYNASFEELWAKKIGGEGSNEKAIDVVISPLGDVAVGGTLASTSLTISDVDSTFTYRYASTDYTHSVITTFTKNGEFRWQYWYGYSAANATMNTLKCTDEGVYYVALYCDGRAGDMSTGVTLAGQNSGIEMIDGQHISHNTNGGTDALYLVVSPEGGLSGFGRPGGQQTESMKDIAISSDKKSIYFLLDLCVRNAIAQIPLNNFFTSYTDIKNNSKAGDFTTITVPCPETVGTGESYTETYKGLFYSGCLVHTDLPVITPEELPKYTEGTPYSQALSLSGIEGTEEIIPLNLPEGFTLENGTLSGNPTGKDPYYITVIASDVIPRYSYFSPYAGDTTWDQTYGGTTTRGNNRNVRNLILRSTEEVNAVNDIKANTDRFYPTIVSETLNVMTKAERFSVNIYNLAGMQVKSVSGQKNIDVSSLSAGIYFAELQTGNNSKTMTKIIVR